MDKIHKNMLILDRKRKFEDLFDLKKMAILMSCVGGASLAYYFYKSKTGQKKGK